jgi:hypothetical protein
MVARRGSGAYEQPNEGLKEKASLAMPTSGARALPGLRLRRHLETLVVVPAASKDGPFGLLNLGRSGGTVNVWAMQTAVPSFLATKTAVGENGVGPAA